MSDPNHLEALKAFVDERMDAKREHMISALKDYYEQSRDYSALRLAADLHLSLETARLFNGSALSYIARQLNDLSNRLTAIEDELTEPESERDAA